MEAPEQIGRRFANLRRFSPTLKAFEIPPGPFRHGSGAELSPTTQTAVQNLTISATTAVQNLTPSSFAKAMAGRAGYSSQSGRKAPPTKQPTDRAMKQPDYVNSGTITAF